MTSVLVVDDQELVRAGLCTVLERHDGIEVLGNAADGRSAIEKARTLRPDVVLMDVRMPVLDGIAATRAITAAAAPPRVLVLTTFDIDEYVYEALRAGASGFLLKDTPPARLAEAIRTVAEGDALLASPITRRLVERFTGSRPDARAALDELTEREVEVLRLVARGLSNAEIADALMVSLPTVKTHVGRILMKLRLRDRVQAVVLAYEAGVVRAGERGGQQPLEQVGRERRLGLARPPQRSGPTAQGARYRARPGASRFQSSVRSRYSAHAALTMPGSPPPQAWSPGTW